MILGCNLPLLYYNVILFLKKDRDTKDESSREQASLMVYKVCPSCFLSRGMRREEVALLEESPKCANRGCF